MDQAICNDSLCCMKYDIINNPMYWLGASFFSGILFSTWSWGLAYLLVGLIIYEIGYYMYCRYQNYQHNLQIRIGILAGAIMGFLIGRSITGTENHYESFSDLKATLKKWLA